MGLMDRMKDAAVQAASEAKQSMTKAPEDVRSVSLDAEPQAVPVVGPRPLLELVSHIDGKNANVRLWPDRIEWERGRGVSAGKITAAALTAGVSLLATGVKGGKDAFEMVQLKHVTNVSNKKNGMLYHLVEVQTSSGAAVNTVAFRVSRDEAAQFRQAILDAIQELDERSSTTVVVQQAAPVAAATNPSVGASDLAAQLHQLGGLRDAGILTEDEFSAKKSEILARI